MMLCHQKRSIVTPYRVYYNEIIILQIGLLSLTPKVFMKLTFSIYKIFYLENEFLMPYFFQF